MHGICVKRAKRCRDSAGLSHVGVPWLLQVFLFFVAFGIATSILDAASIHPERSGGLDCRQHAGLCVEPSRASKPSVAGKGKTPPGSCSVAPSDRSQCDSTGPAAVWADDQAVTRALAARKSPRQTCARGRCRGWFVTAANGDGPQDPGATARPAQASAESEMSVSPAEVPLNTAYHSPRAVLPGGVQALPPTCQQRHHPAGRPNPASIFALGARNARASSKIFLYTTGRDRQYGWHGCACDVVQ